MPFSHFLRATLLVAVAAATGLAALPIELEVAAQSDAPFGAIQEWHKVLAEMDLARVRLRGANRGDEPRLEVRESGGVKRYQLLGVLNRRDELVLPGGKFGQGDRAALKEFFATLPARHAESGIQRARFGLTEEQFSEVMLKLSRTFDESTLDGAPHELLTALTKEVDLPVAGDLAIKAKLRDAAPFRSQCKGLSVGTTLAAMLRSAGLQFAPDTLGAEPLTLRVVPLDPAVESWPVGWAPATSPRELAPTMYRFTNIEIANFTLDKALDALAPHMGLPMVLDGHVLRAREIDLAKASVKFPRGKTYVRRAVDAVLSQGRLAGELRVDEAGQPFYWITQFGKDSPRATEVERERAKD